MNFEFMTIDTPLPPCMPFPKALTGFPVSSTAKVMYCRMLDAMLLRVWRKEYAPHSPEEVFHPRFVEALQKQDHVEYLLDVLLFGETEEKAALITEYGKDVIQLEQRMAELAAADAARTKKHHERHAAAPEH